MCERFTFEELTRRWRMKRPIFTQQPTSDDNNYMQYYFDSIYLCSLELELIN